MKFQETVECTVSNLSRLWRDAADSTENARHGINRHNAIHIVCHQMCMFVLQKLSSVWCTQYAAKCNSMHRMHIINTLYKLRYYFVFIRKCENCSVMHSTTSRAYKKKIKYGITFTLVLWHVMIHCWCVTEISQKKTNINCFARRKNKNKKKKKKLFSYPLMSIICWFVFSIGTWYITTNKTEVINASSCFSSIDVILWRNERNNLIKMNEMRIKLISFVSMWF